MNCATNMPCVTRKGLVAASSLQRGLLLKRPLYLKLMWCMTTTTSATMEMICHATWLLALFYQANQKQYPVRPLWHHCAHHQPCFNHRRWRRCRRRRRDHQPEQSKAISTLGSHVDSKTIEAVTFVNVIGTVDGMSVLAELARLQCETMWV